MIARGAGIWVASGSVGLACPVASAVGSPTSSALFTFQFPRSVFLTGLLALPRKSAVLAYNAQCAALSLFATDEAQRPIFSDSRGTLQGTNAVPVAGAFLGLFGKAFHPYALQRPIRAGANWSFRVQNADPANAAVLAGLYFYFSEPKR